MILNNEQYRELANEKGCIVKALKDKIDAINDERGVDSTVFWWWLITEEVEDRILIDIRRLER